MGKHKIKPQQIEAVQLRLEGWTARRIAEKIGVCEDSIRKWWVNEDVHEYYQKELKHRTHQIFNKAVCGLNRDMDSENPWIRANAQRQAIDKYSDMVMGNDKQEITVHLVGGMPDVGMPQRSDED